jgi:hypothetical protein
VVLDTTHRGIDRKGPFQSARQTLAAARILRRVLQVLLIDEGWTQTADCAFALADCGLGVVVATANGSHRSFRSHGVHWQSVAKPTEAGFVADVDSLAKFADLVVPLTESTMQQLHQSDATCKSRMFPLIDDHVVNVALDKFAVVQHAQQAGIATPQQRMLHHDDTARFLVKEFGLPMVFKRRVGHGGRRVVMAAHIDQVAKLLQKSTSRTCASSSQWIVQRYVGDATFLAAGLFSNGQPLRWYCGQKIEQYPERTGPAIRVRSFNDPELLNIATRLLQAVPWTGLASADFVRGNDGQFYFVDFNPRPWGCITTAIEAGVDLLSPYAEMLQGRDVEPILHFENHIDSLVFPRYLLAQKYRSFAGLRHAYNDLKSRRGQHWRSIGFSLFQAQRALASHVDRGW